MPLQKGMIRIIINNIHDFYYVEKSQPYLALLFKAMILTGYYGLFRVGELTESQHVIRKGDVKKAKNKQKILIVLRSSKTHSINKASQMVNIRPLNIAQERHQNDLDRYCPYQILRKYASIRPKTQKTTQFFVFSGSSPVKGDHFRVIL